MSVTLTMGSAGEPNPRIWQPGAILFDAGPDSDSAPIARWMCDLSHENYERYTEALDALSDIHLTNMFGAYRQACLELMKVIGEGYKALYEDKISTIRPDDFVEWMVKIRAAILGVCAMIHHHQETSYTEVKRKFGTDSAEHTVMKEVFAEIYDNCFGYRYLYKLRNCMVHYSMRAVDVATDSRSHEGQDLRWFEITMKRSVMLDAKKLLNAQLRTELEALEEDPDIVAMQTDAFKALQKANRRIVEIQYPEIAEICATVREFDELFEGRDGVRGVATSRSTEIRSPFTFTFDPIAGQIIMAARVYGQIAEGED